MKYFLLVSIFLSFFAQGYFRKLPTVCPNIISRREWGARPSTDIDYMITPAKFAIIGHTATGTCNNEDDCIDVVTGTQNHHMDVNHFNDIGYNFLIGGDGNVYEGVGWGLVGAHTYGYNRKGVGIAFIGNFEDNNPTQAAVNAAKNLLACGQQIRELDSIYTLMAQRDIIASLSPGKNLYRIIRKWPQYSKYPPV